MYANLAPSSAQRTVRRYYINKSKSDLVAHNSGSGGPSAARNFYCDFSGEDQFYFYYYLNCGSFMNQFTKSFVLTNIFIWKSINIYSRIQFYPFFFYQNIYLPKYNFIKILFYQNIILLKYYFIKILFYHNIILPNYYFIKI